MSVIFFPIWHFFLCWCTTKLQILHHSITRLNKLNGQRIDWKEGSQWTYVLHEKMDMFYYNFVLSLTCFTLHSILFWDDIDITVLASCTKELIQMKVVPWRWTTHPFENLKTADRSSMLKAWKCGYSWYEIIYLYFLYHASKK